MKWLIDNWSFLVVMACIFGIAVVYIHKFVNLPSNSQLVKVKQWLLFAVIEAEKQYQGGTGELKLRAYIMNFAKCSHHLCQSYHLSCFHSLWMKHLCKCGIF